MINNIQLYLIKEELDYITNQEIIEFKALF